MSLFLSWGKNFGLLTDLMIDYFPMYNKFRAVSSIQVILELCAPILAVLALGKMFSDQLELKEKLQALKLSFFIVSGLAVVLFLIKGIFDFKGPNDDFLIQNYGDELVSLIKSDRKAVYNSDLFRSFLYVLLTAGVLWFYLKSKIKMNVAVLLIGGLLLFDLVGVGLRYVNSDDFVSKRRMTEPFPETALDKEILKDEGIYRVYNPAEGINGARTSYYHQSIGGYHAAKPAALEDLFSFHIYKGNMNVLNMLNVKYVIQQDEEGRSYPAVNPQANGNAWFVEKVKVVSTADDEIQELENLDTKREAVVTEKNADGLNRFDFVVDSTATIELVDYQPNHLIYQSANDNLGVAVFSEMYYPHGWKVSIDEEEVKPFKANYSLRALRIPAGKHTIEFKFEPEVVAKGSKITLASSIVLGLAFISAVVFSLVGLPDSKKEITEIQEDSSNA